MPDSNIWVKLGLKNTQRQRQMAQLKITLDDKKSQIVKQKAKELGYSAQEWIEMVVERIVSEPTIELFGYENNDTQDALFTFIDLFAGIGGIRLGFERNGGKCVFSSEWDKWSKKTYFVNYGVFPEGDITKINPQDIPSHDILTAGFPCQPFSIAGVSKKNSLGREHGFKDVTQGTLFFNVASIIEEKRPKMFLLENVKNLQSHDKGRTFNVIKDVLEELQYKIFYKVVDAKAYVPQHRERIFIVGFDKNFFGSDLHFSFPTLPASTPKLGDILEDEVDKKYILTDHLWQYLQNYAQKHKEKGNGFGFGLVNSESVSRTLSARYYKDGSEILVQVKDSNPRRLTPRECARLMGYPDTFRIPVSDTQAYRQFGNSVVVPVVKDIAAEMLKIYKLYLNSRKAKSNGSSAHGKATPSNGTYKKKRDKIGSSGPELFVSEEMYVAHE